MLICIIGYEHSWYNFAERGRNRADLKFNNFANVYSHLLYSQAITPPPHHIRTPHEYLVN